MAIITNNDIKIMVDVEELLHQKLVETNAIIDVDEEGKEYYYFNEGDEEVDIWNKYWNVVERLIQAKKDIASKQNKWNKENKMYHRITNNITYNKKIGNKEREEYWRNKLKEYKENDSKQTHRIKNI